jgi:L-threonylcarbamoyladenylate synthase
METDVKKAVEILKDGGIVIFPTDTAFGIGCRIDRPDSIQRLFKIRRRPETKATPVLVDTVKMAQEYLEPIPQDVIDKLIEPYWPGALTLILHCNRVKVPELVRGGTTTLGVRIPNHPVARQLIRETGVPILGPSANFSGEQTPYAFQQLNPELIKLVDAVVSGECTVKQASTVVDTTVKPWKVIREGAVKLNQE